MPTPLLAPLESPGKCWLIAAAAPAEARAVAEGLTCVQRDQPFPRWQEASLSPRFSLVVTGVGKACAAAGVARVYDPRRHLGVLNVGVAGALPESGLGLLDVILATESVYADEGALTARGWVDIAAMGFPPDASGRMGAPASPGLVEALAALGGARGRIATVSTCSGTDTAAAEVRARTGARAEAMEGAAAGFTARGIGGSECLFAELRVISNTTGDRERQVWKLPDALARLREALSLL